MKKVILFTQRVEIVEAYQERRDCADQRVADFIQACGYLPIPVPNNGNIAKEIVQFIKPAGLILTGGNSLARYGGNASERDLVDSLLIGTAVKSKLPLFGFCRGMQSILEYFGNELIDVEGHVAVKHKISGDEPSKAVNSYHRQGCRQLKNNELQVVMRSDDGVIEKIRHKELGILGIMWHPEREAPYSNEDIKMLVDLVEGNGGNGL
jgi:putative glutamine amidotransferase